MNLHLTTNYDNFLMLVLKELNSQNYIPHACAVTNDILEDDMPVHASPTMPDDNQHSEAIQPSKPFEGAVQIHYIYEKCSIKVFIVICHGLFSNANNPLFDEGKCPWKNEVLPLLTTCKWLQCRYCASME